MLSVITNKQLEKVLKKLYLNTDTNISIYKISIQIQTCIKIPI